MGPNIMSNIRTAAITITPMPPPKQQPKISPDDIVIAVMGSTGAGKTTFIQDLTNQKLKIGSTLESCTQEVDAHLCNLTGYSKKIWLLDTPGFDDAYKTDAEILAEVAKYLGDLYANKILLTGIVYLQRIQDPRTSNAAMRNIRTFKKLCGEDALSRTVLVTTYWRYVTAEEGRQREEELVSRGTLWKLITDRGGKVFQYHQSPESAKQVIDYIVTAKLGKAALAIQVDLIDRRMKLGDTEAGAEVRAQMTQLQQYEKEMIQRLKTALVIQADLIDRRMKLGDTEAGAEALAQMTQLQPYEKEILQKLKAGLAGADNQNDEDLQDMKEVIEKEMQTLEERVEQFEHDVVLLDLTNEGLVKRIKVAWRVLVKKSKSEGLSPNP